MNERTISDEQFIHDCIITVMQDDPSKIIEVRELSEGMPIMEGETTHEIMSEEALHQFKVNAESFPELKTIDEDKVMRMLEHTFIEKGW